MAIFSAEIGKKTIFLSAPSMDEAIKTLSHFHKGKEMKIGETVFPENLKFKIGDTVICSASKLKGDTVSFTTSSNTSGKINISLLPIELVQALP